MDEKDELQVYQEMGALSPDHVQAQVNLIQKVLKGVMKPNIHYGVIPGTGKKPTLLKPGAEKICLTFRLAPSYNIEDIEHDYMHLEYRVVCTLTHIPTGKVFGQGVGSCSTLEGKYRFRTGEVELTDKPVPQAYWQDRDIELIGGKGHTTRKDPDTGKWVIALAGEKVEHDNPPDYYNTILKMAKKRAMVDAVLTCTAASDCFNQDLEDMKEVISGAKDFEQKPEPVDAEVVDPEKDVTEQEWLEGERKRDEANRGPEGQEDIPFEKRPFPGDKDKPKKISKARGGVLYAKLKGVPGWGEDDREQFLKDIGVKSVYEVPEDTFENVKNLLDGFYKKK